MVSALVKRDGGTPEVIGSLPNNRPVIREALYEAANPADLILISGGSSAGREDHVPGIITEFGRLVAHGLALRPASPTGVGVFGDASIPVVLLPGNPVSCLCAHDFFAGTTARLLGARHAHWPYRSIRLPLARKLVSVVGRVDYARVRIKGGLVEPLAISGAAILTSVSRADAFVVVPEDLEGYAAGASVLVWCYDDDSRVEPTSANCGASHSTAEDGQSIRSAHQTPDG